jgi:hypothetical protein
VKPPWVVAFFGIVAALEGTRLVRAARRRGA